MTPNDYTLIIKKIAEDFVIIRAGEQLEKQRELLFAIKNNPAETEYYGYMISKFMAYHNPQKCAEIVVSSPSQNIDSTIWKNLPPREALYTMGFELLKCDVLNEVIILLEENTNQKHLFSNPGEQLTMFGAA